MPCVVLNSNLAENRNTIVDKRFVMQLKKKNPILHWVIMMITFGQYAFIWAFLMARDVNELQGEEKIEIKKNAKIFVLLWSIYFIVFVYLNLRYLTGIIPPAPLFFGEFTLGVVLLIFFIRVVLKVGSELRKMKEENIPSTENLIFLSLIYMISLPILQSKINKILKHR